MKKFVLMVGALVIIGSSLVWLMNSPYIDDQYRIYKWKGSERALEIAFTIALRRNHSYAYQMTVPKLHPRLDEWMSSHEPQYCKDKPYLLAGGPGTNIGSQMRYGCTNEKPIYTAYTFVVDDIVVENMKIVDWGKVKDGY